MAHQLMPTEMHEMHTGLCDPAPARLGLYHAFMRIPAWASAQDGMRVQQTRFE